MIGGRKGWFLPGARVTCVMLFVTQGQSPFLIGLRRLVQFQRSLLGVLGHEVRSLAREARGHHAKWFNCCGPGTRQAPASSELGAPCPRFLSAQGTPKQKVAGLHAQHDDGFLQKILAASHGDRGADKLKISRVALLTVCVTHTHHKEPMRKRARSARACAVSRRAA